MSILPRHCQSGMKELSTVAAAARHRQKSIRTHAVLVLFSRFEFLLTKISRLQVPGPPFHLLYKWARSSSPQAPAPGSISRPGSSSLLFFGISDSILEFRTSSSGIISLPLISLSLTPSPSLAPSPSPAHTSPFIPLPPFLSLSPLISLLLLLQLPESLSLSCSLLPLFLSICLSFSLSGLASRL